jgi:Protein of unknown function (DUF1579)
MMKSEPQREHLWLHKLIGDWTYDGEVIEPGKPSQKFRGTESVRSLGDLWVIAESAGEIPGGDAATMILTLGYNPEKKRYVGTWIGSMMSHLWVYDGALDAAERALSLNAEGPSMAGDGKTATYKDVIELESDAHRILTSHVQGDDGKWHQFMRADYRRTS